MARARESPGENQAGGIAFGLLEVVLACTLGLMVMLTAGFLFLGQVKGYKDIQAQTVLQSQSKIALIHITRDISNVGAGMDDKRWAFTMKADTLRFSYIDMLGRFCATVDTLVMGFYVDTVSTGYILERELTCHALGRPAGTALITWKRRIIETEGALTMNFQYYAQSGSSTYTANLVHYIIYTLDMKTKSGKSLFLKDRFRKVRVDLTN